MLAEWSVSHVMWGFILGCATSAPACVAAWKIGMLFVVWELWENVIEVAFSTYAPGEYHGDSVINSLFDMIPSMSGVWLGRHAPGVWPVIVLTEAWATRMGFGIHSVFLGHQGSICDVRADPVGCSKAYILRLVLLPLLFRWVEGGLWVRWERARSVRQDVATEPPPGVDGAHDPAPSTSLNASPVLTRHLQGADATPEAKLVKRRVPVGSPPDFKL